MTEPKHIGELHCPKIIPTWEGMADSVTFKVKFDYVDPEFMELVSGGTTKVPAGFHWEPVPKHDPEYDEAYCTHRLVRDDS